MGSRCLKPKEEQRIEISTLKNLNSNSTVETKELKNETTYAGKEAQILEVQEPSASKDLP